MGTTKKPESVEKPLFNLAKKVIQMNKELFILEKVYFNPVYIEEFYTKLKDLKEDGYTYRKSEVESKQGTIIDSYITSPNDEELDLGSVLLDGEVVKVVKPLVRVDKLVSFFK